MSFKCSVCKKTDKKPHTVVLETRPHTHTEVRKDDYGNVMTVTTGEGTQIVREAKMCSGCAPLGS